jgi:HlyD family secretion protein
MNAKTCLLLVGLTVLLLGVGGAGWMANHLWGPPSHAATSGGSTEEVEEGVVCTGFVDLEHGIRSLAPLHPGRVAAILVKENKHVKAGTPILRLEEDDARFQVDEAEAALTAAQVQCEQAVKLEAQHRAQLAQQQAAIEAAGFRAEAARLILKRKEGQVKDYLANSEDVRIARNEVKALEAQHHAEEEKLTELKAVDPSLTVRKAQAEVKRARTRRDQAKHQLDECTLKAPADGTVQRITMGAGDIVTGNPTQPIVRFSPDEEPLVRVEVNQEFAQRVKEGQPALIRDDTRAGTSWHGKVARIADWFERRRPDAQDPTAYTDVRTVECLITIDPGQPPLRIGQRMRVLIGNVPALTR